MRLKKSPSLCFGLFASLAAALVPVSAQAVLAPAPFYTDNMVFQREQPIVIVGYADANAEVSAAFMTAHAKAKADADGKFRLELPATAAEKDPQTLTFKSNGQTLALTNIVVGDVWLCSGQSNMEWQMTAFKSAPYNQAAIDAAEMPLLRRIKFKTAYDTDIVPFDRVQIREGWCAATPKEVLRWGATGFYFGRKILQESGVPIGLIECNWGGTRIEPWMPIEAFEKGKFDGERAAWAARHGRNAQSIRIANDFAAKRDAGLVEKDAKAPSPLWNQQSPSSLYNTMIDPVSVLAIRGAIWYQGCSNAGDPAYAAKSEAMVAAWRKKYGWQFPFYFVQLANFRAPTDDEPGVEDGYPFVRQQQLLAWRATPLSGMAVAIDIGEEKDIHPKNKLDVGERLARWALRDCYGQKDLCVSGPLVKKLVPEGSKVRVVFDYADGLMVAKKSGVELPQAIAGTPACFALKDEAGAWHWADAVIDGQSVVLSCEAVKKPIAVRYAYATNPHKANLFNKAGLPAVPFALAIGEKW